MEPATFTLVIWTTTWALWTTDEIRFPGFGEIECKLLAAERVKPPKKARCGDLNQLALEKLSTSGRHRVRQWSARPFAARALSLVLIMLI
jgi:hypothetical protein